MKRKFFWLGYLLAIGALLWILWRQRRDEMEEILERVRQAAPGSGDWMSGGRMTPPGPRRVARDATPASPAQMEPAAQNTLEDDDLQQISGIGPVYARRLEEAGITRYAQLAALTAQEVRERIQLEDWRGGIDSWIAQARALAN